MELSNAGPDLKTTKVYLGSTELARERHEDLCPMGPLPRTRGTVSWRVRILSSRELRIGWDMSVLKRVAYWMGYEEY